MSGSSHPENPDVFQAQVAGEKPPRRSNRRALMMILAILGLMSAPMIYNWLPSEAARWRMAAAEERRLDGDLEGAIQSLDEAIIEFPESAEFYLRRAAYHSEAEEYEKAIHDLDQARIGGADLDVVLTARSYALHQVGKYAEAIEAGKELVRLSEEEQTGSTWEALNALAYARALHGTELKEGLGNADEAIRLAGPRHNLLDTRGYLYYLLDDYASAISDLEQAVANAEAFYSDTERLKGLPDARILNLFEKQGQEVIAIIRYHRSLVYDKQGEREKAKADRDRVRELGFEPNASLF